jgi:hypothetical protein
MEKSKNRFSTLDVAAMVNNLKTKIVGMRSAFETKKPSAILLLDVLTFTISPTRAMSSNLQELTKRNTST